MELPQITVEVLVVALGNTDTVEEELLDLGFRWSQVNQVWYNLSNWTKQSCESWATETKGSPWPGVYFRFFLHSDNEWTEIYQ